MKSHFASGLWPVVQRELRETARRPLNNWLRLGGAFVGVVIFCFTSARVPDNMLGPELFGNIHLLLVCLICGLIPALTADCIARERREGTLGLLFMTPLTASGIVVGKVIAQVLRGLTLWLALMPLLAIPFLYGGVTWADIAAFLTIELCAGMLCLAAGILASSLTDHRALAFILAFLFTGAFVGEARQFMNLTMMGSTRGRFTSGRFLGMGGVSYIVTSVTTSPGFRVRMNGVPFGSLRGVGPVAIPTFASSQPPPGVLAEGFLVSALILLLSVRFAGSRVERSWQDKMPSVRQQSLAKKYCTPLFANSFTRGMKRTLEWNPIAWLQQYSWKARCSKWGLCLLFVVLLCFSTDGNDLGAFGQTLMSLLLIMVAAYTFAGVNGFLQEKKSGALELILVSPISIDQIIFGRVWGLWKQFLPSALVLVGSDIAFHEAIGQHSYYYGSSWATVHGGLHWMIDFEIVAIYLTLPVVATCLALTSKNLFMASALTVAIVFGPAVIVLFPGLLRAVLVSFHLPFGVDLLLAGLLALATFPITVLIAHVYSAALAYRHLQRSLRRRTYAY